MVHILKQKLEMNDEKRDGSSSTNENERTFSIPKSAVGKDCILAGEFVCYFLHYVFRYKVNLLLT